MSVSTFRASLVASVIVGLLGSSIDFMFPSLLAESFRQAQESQDAALSTQHVLLLGGLGVVALVVTLASVYGLYTFRWWALRTAIVATALGLLLLLLSGAYAQSGPAIALSYIASYLWGAVLLAAATQPLSSRFQRHDG